MTPQEALHEISTKVFRNTDDFEMKISKDCYKEVVKALESRTPEKYLLIDGRCVCPTCKSNQGYLHQYCNNCGQKYNGVMQNELSRDL